MSYCVTLGKLLTSSVSHFLSSWISINNTTYFLWLLAGWNEVRSTQRGWDGAQFVANAHSVLSTIITTIIISVLCPAPLVCPFFSLSSTFLFIGQAISRASLSEDEHPSSCRFRKCSWLFPSSDSCCCLGFQWQLIPESLLVAPLLLSELSPQSFTATLCLYCHSLYTGTKQWFQALSLIIDGEKQLSTDLSCPARGQRACTLLSTFPRGRREERRETDRFQIGKGVHQGCILSPCLFHFCAEYIMKNAKLDESQAGIKLPGEI